MKKDGIQTRKRKPKNPGTKEPKSKAYSTRNNASNSSRNSQQQQQQQQQQQEQQHQQQEVFAAGKKSNNFLCLWDFTYFYREYSDNTDDPGSSSGFGGQHGNDHVHPPGPDFDSLDGSQRFDTSGLELAVRINDLYR